MPTGIFCRARLSTKRPTSPRAVACRDAGPRRSCHLPTADVCREPLSANVFFAESPRFCSRQKSRISAKDVFPVVGNAGQTNLPCICKVTNAIDSAPHFGLPCTKVQRISLNSGTSTCPSHPCLSCTKVFIVLLLPVEDTNWQDTLSLSVLSNRQ